MSNIGFNDKPLFPGKNTGKWRKSKSLNLPRATAEEIKKDWKEDTGKAIQKLKEFLK